MHYLLKLLALTLALAALPTNTVVRAMEQAELEKIEDVEEEGCAICGYSYNDHNGLKKILPCDHELCIRCIIDTIKQQPFTYETRGQKEVSVKSICPFCRWSRNEDELKVFATAIVEEACAVYDPNSTLYLNFTGLHITSIPLSIAKDIARFVNLKELLMPDCNLTALPLGIDECKELEGLSLSANPLLGSSLDVLRGCKKISVLFLNDCNVKDISWMIDLFNLEHLSLSGNKEIDCLPLLGGMQNLKNLSLGSVEFLA